MLEQENFPTSFPTRYYKNSCIHTLYINFVWYSLPETSEPFATAITIVNFFLYLSVTVVSGYFFFKFRAEVEKKKSLPYTDMFGRFDRPKMVFFLVLCISSIMDTPLNLSCIILGSPRDCEWNGLSYPFLWSLHLMSLNGYAYTVMTPLILWSDIINNKDGKLFFSTYPVDCTKRFFQCLMLLYFISTALILIWLIIFFDINNESNFGLSIFAAFNDCFESFIICLITSGCLWCGLRLQLYIIDVQFGSTVQVEILTKLNITMSIIVICYLARALLVLRLFTLMPWDYKVALRTSYFLWLIGTRWMPYIACSFFLMTSMSQSGAELAQRTMATSDRYSQESVDALLDMSSGSTHSIDQRLLKEMRPSDEEGSSRSYLNTFSRIFRGLHRGDSVSYVSHGTESTLPTDEAPTSSKNSSTDQRSGRQNWASNSSDGVW